MFKKIKIKFTAQFCSLLGDFIKLVFIYWSTNCSSRAQMWPSNIKSAAREVFLANHTILKLKNCKVL